MTNNEAFALLGVPFGASKALVNAAYRRRALQVHPDRGGSVTDFQLLLEAKAIALAYSYCATCSGTGVIKVMVGFHTYTSLCESCKNSCK